MGAECKNHNGHWITTEINYDHECPQQNGLRDADGQLMCVIGFKGSFRHSCAKKTIKTYGSDRHMLEANCRTKPQPGHWKWNHFDLYSCRSYKGYKRSKDYVWLSNRHGNLECTRNKYWKPAWLRLSKDYY